MENTEMAETETATLMAQENNFLEISADDDNIEYVGYEQDEGEEYVVLEQDYDEAVLNEPKTSTNSMTGMKEEEAVSEELYHCNTCDIYINAIDEHINEFHKNESVYFEGDDDIPAAEDSTEANTNNDDDHVDDELTGVADRPIKIEVEDDTTMYTVECFLDDDMDNDYITEMTDTEAASSLSSEIIKQEDTDTLCICPSCKIKFSSEKKLRSHKCTANNKVNARSRPKMISIDQVVCDVCNTTFTSNKSYRLHARMHGPVKTRPVEEAVSYELKASAKDGQLPNETFLCDICNKSYDITFKDVHEKSHISGPTFTCRLCNKKFSDEINYDMHMKAHSENPKTKPPTKAERNGIKLPYECSYCGRQFARPHEKVKHERIHTGEKPYKCDICGKCFRVAYCLTLHLRTHTAARPYVCPHCNKRFKAHSGYSHHLLIHSDERAYKCPHCPKAFKTAVQLAGHKNSHTKPFSCPECNRPFASLYAVKAHMETHVRSGHTLRHRCTICGAIYARVFALRDHMKEQHQTNYTEGDDITSDIHISEEAFLNETEASTQSILSKDEKSVSGMITIDDMDHFQAEEVVTDWLK